MLFLLTNKTPAENADEGACDHEEDRQEDGPFVVLAAKDETGP